MIRIERLWGDGARRVGLLAAIFILGLAGRFLHDPFSVWIDIDESIVLFEGKALLQGLLIYRDIFVMQTPGMAFTVAGVFSLFGKNYLLMRFLTIALSSLTAIPLYVVGREVWGERAGVFAAVLYQLHPLVLTLSTFTWYTIYWTFFLVCAIALFMTYQRTDRTKHLVLAGIATGLAFMYKQPGILIAMPIVGHLLASRRKRAVAIYLMSLALSLLPLAFYLISKGIVRDFYECAFAFGPSLARTGAFDTLLTRFFTVGWAATPLLIIVALVGGAVGIARVVREFGQGRQLAFLLSSTAVYAVYYLFIVFALFSYKVYVIVSFLAVYASLAVVWLLGVARRRVSRAGAAFLGAFLVLWLVSYQGDLSRFYPNTMEASGGDLRVQKDVAAWVMEHSLEDDLVFAYNPTWYFLIDRPALIVGGHLHFWYPLVKAARLEGALGDEVAVRALPRYIVIEKVYTRGSSFDFPCGDLTFWDLVERRYEVVREVDGGRVLIMMRNDEEKSSGLIDFAQELAGG